MRRVRFSTKEDFADLHYAENAYNAYINSRRFPSSNKVTDLQLEELAQLKVQSSKIVIVENQFPQIAQP